MRIEVILGMIIIAVGPAILFMIFFNRERIRQLDEIAIGRRITPDSFPHMLLRATDYGFASTFEFCARRTHPGVDFGRIPREIKRPFRVICVLNLIGLACLISGAVVIYG